MQFEENVKCVKLASVEIDLVLIHAKSCLVQTSLPSPADQISSTGVQTIAIFPGEVRQYIKQFFTMCVSCSLLLKTCCLI